VAPRGVATKLSLAIAFVLLLSVGALSLLAVTMSRQSLRDQVSSANRTAANLAARAIDLYLADAASIMREASGRPKLSQEIRTAKWAEAARVLDNFLHHFPQFDYVFVQDPHGIIRVRVPDAPTVGQDFSHREFFQAVARTRALYIFDVYVSQAAQRPVVSIAVPVLEGGSEVKGVLVGALSLKAMSDVVSAISKEDAAQLYVVDRKGTLIARSHGNWATSRPEDLTSLPIVQAVLAGETGTIEFTDPASSEALLGAHVPIARLGWGVVGTKSVSTAFAPADRLSRWLLGTALGCGALAVVLGWRLARTLTGPLTRLASATDRVATGDFDVRVPVEGRDEVAALATSFNRMLNVKRGIMHPPVSAGNPPQDIHPSRDRCQVGREGAQVLADDRPDRRVTRQQSHPSGVLRRAVSQGPHAIPCTEGRQGAILLPRRAAPRAHARSHPGRMRSAGTSTRRMPLKLNRSSTSYTRGSADTRRTTVANTSRTFWLKCTPPIVTFDRSTLTRWFGSNMDHSTPPSFSRPVHACQGRRSRAAQRADSIIAASAAPAAAAVAGVAGVRVWEPAVLSFGAGRLRSLGATDSLSSAQHRPPYDPALPPHRA
jgi:HAMP domain-containing protein